MNVAMRPLVVLVAGDTVPAARVEGGFFELVERATGDAWDGPWLAVSVFRGEAVPPLDAVAGLVVSGSPASVTERADWMLRTEAVLREAVHAGVPTFGICFGHQMLGKALGGVVERNPRGREIGTVAVEVVADDELLGAGRGVGAAGTTMLANATHLDAVLEPPAGARVLARTALDECSVVRFAESAWGVQFHPEIDARVMRGYLADKRAILASEGLDADGLEAAVDDATEAREVLRRFARAVPRR